jgi:hypothetical protein
MPIPRVKKGADAPRYSPSLTLAYIDKIFLPIRPLGDRAMPLLHLVIVLIVVGILLWLVNTYIPMDPKIKSILNAVVVICVIVWLLQVFGVLGALSGFRVGHA